VLSSVRVGLFAQGGVNPVPPSTAVVSVAFGAAVLRYRLLDLPPLAYTTAMRSSPDAVLVCDDDARVVHANEAGRDLLGRQSATTGDRIDAVLDGLDSTVARETVTVDASDGTRFLDARSRRLERAGAHVGWVVVLRDVTDRRRRQQELERTNERLDQFASIVSHDLRNPLTVATGYLDLLDDEYDGDDDYVDRIDGALARMEQIVEDTLALARQGRAVSDPEWVGLDSLAREAWGGVETADATLACDVDGVRIRCDPERVRHVFENLFRNAVEHGGDDVDVHLGRLADGFSVEDDGPGIPHDDRDRLFEPGHTTADGGSGFGLAIVETVVEAHDWRVSATDGPTGGARFEITGVDVDTRVDDHAPVGADSTADADAEATPGIDDRE
jgi:signal transduction histidine kinase